MDLTLLLHRTPTDFPTTSPTGHIPTQTLLYKLLKLYKSGIEQCLCVVDGPGKPALKRNGTRRPAAHLPHTEHHLTAVVEPLVEMFGWSVIRAGGEAEAECAYLESMGVVDAVMTDDSDAFIFGAQTVIRTSLVWQHGLGATPLEGEPLAPQTPHGAIKERVLGTVRV
jgi:hypothetical protein